MSEFEVRKAEVEDAARIAEINVTGWQTAYKGLMPDELLNDLSIERSTKHWQEELSADKRQTQLFVAEQAGKVAGFIGVGPCRDEDLDKTFGELWLIYVDPNMKGQGVGSLLMEKGMDYLRECGYEKACLWVLSTNEDSIKWYENRGWKADGKTKVVKRGDFDMHESRYILMFERI